MAGRYRALVATVALGALGLVSACGSPVDPGMPEATADARTGRDPAAQFQISAIDMGIHSFSTRPELPTAAIRLNCFPGWSSVNTAKGEFDWVDFDRIVAQAEGWGYQDILYVFCSTPAWAGEPITGPDEAVFGPGTAQPPAQMADFEAYVRAVVQRYKGRIDGYEVWNEPSSPQFYTGTPQEMGEMTQVVHDIVEQEDPGAFVLSAGFQTHLPEVYDGFIPEYFADLRTRGWPVDAVSAHFYPVASGTPATRSEQIERVRKDMDRFEAPSDVALWDTEVNFNVESPGGSPTGRIIGPQAAAWAAQAYLEGWRLGVRRTYWYLWSAEYYGFPGIQMRAGDPATKAVQVLGAWVIGSTYLGCEDADKAVSCRFRTSDGTEFLIAWSNSPGGGRLTAATGTSVCPVDGSVCTSNTGDVAVTDLPVRIG